MPPAEFVSLAQRLRRAAVQPVAEAAEPAGLESPADARVRADAERADSGAHDGVVDVLRDARLFRARLADAFDAHLARLLREIAAAVLGRELRIAPCDLRALVARVAGDLPIVRVRVCVDDAPCVRGMEIAIDPSLAPGDVIVELAGGTLDARLGVRLAAVLEACA